MIIRAFTKCFYFRDNVVDGETERFEQLLAEGGHPGDSAVQALILKRLQRPQLYKSDMGAKSQTG